MAAALTARAPPLDLLSVRWRRAAAETNPSAWLVELPDWPVGKRIRDVREQLAAKKKSPADEYEKHENLPELYHVAFEGSVTKVPVAGVEILTWTNTTYADPLLDEKHPVGHERKAFVLFTFPSAPAGSTGAAGVEDETAKRLAELTLALQVQATTQREATEALLAVTKSQQNAT